MTVPFDEEEDPRIEPEPSLSNPIRKSGNLEYGGDVWVKIMAWIIGGGLAVLVLMLIVALVIYLGKHLF